VVAESRRCEPVTHPTVQARPAAVNGGGYEVSKWWEGLTARQLRLFAHWIWVTGFKYSL
jgi:hypothetical protein